MKGPPSQDVLQKCTKYSSSKTHDRYFCSTCGSKVFINAHHRQSGEARDDSQAWFTLSGAVDPLKEGGENVLYVEQHEWLDDTGDGGMAPFMTKLGGRDIPCYDSKTGQVSKSDLQELIESSIDLSSPGPDDTLKAECRCGGVSLLIQRANHSERHISQLDRFIPKDSNGKVENDKHIALCCVCRSCRHHLGTSLATWIYVPPMQVLNAHTGKPVVQHRAISGPGQTAAQSANRGLTLEHYWTSENICWAFCSICGAGAFHSADKRQEIVNVAAGLLRAEEGIMARKWLSWQWGRTSWKEDVADREIMEAWRATEGTGGRIRSGLT